MPAAVRIRSTFPFRGRGHARTHVARLAPCHVLSLALNFHGVKVPTGTAETRVDSSQSHTTCHSMVRQMLRTGSAHVDRRVALGVPRWGYTAATLTLGSERSQPCQQVPSSSCIIAVLVLITILSSLRICNEWERKVVLRLGRFGGVRGPGIFFLLPYLEQTPFTIDTRVVTTPFLAEQTLTKDGASVTVDAIMYWRIVDAGRAAIQVANFTQAVMGAAQGGLRDIIGRNDLSTVLSQRRELDEQLTRHPRRADRAVGHQGPVGSAARHQSPRQSAGSAVAHRPGRARTAGAVDPRLERGAGRGPVRRGGRAVPGSIRPRCTCAA